MANAGPNPSVPAWESDELDSPTQPEIKPPYFDHALQAWVLSRYADVVGAFLSPHLSPTGQNNKEISQSSDDEMLLAEMRAETLQALSPTDLAKWREQVAQEAQARVAAMPMEQCIDLVEEFARPVCLSLAIAVTQAEPKDALHLRELAEHPSASAAEPHDKILRERAASANEELRCYFKRGPVSLRDSGFVALSQTLPCLLANAWFGLLTHPEQWSRLHHHPNLLPQAMEELLRYAGLPRILSRRATADAEINGTPVKQGDRLILRIISANRDPERFQHSEQLDIERRDQGQLTFGAGSHACVGAGLLRMASVTITAPLLERFPVAFRAGTVEWRGGSGFRAPRNLPVVLSQKVAFLNREAAQ